MKFDDRCKTNLLRAQEEAKALRHQKVEPEHVLWLEMQLNDARLVEFLDTQKVSKAHVQGVLKKRMEELPRSASPDTREASTRLKGCFEKAAKDNGSALSWRDLVVAAIEIENDPLTEVIWDCAITPYEFRNFNKTEQELATVTLGESEKDDVLSKYCVDLVKLAELGKLGAVA